MQTKPTYIESDRGILTVSKLLELLEGVDGDTHIVVDDHQNDWYNNIQGVQLADADSYICISLIAGEPLDTWQF